MDKERSELLTEAQIDEFCEAHPYHAQVYAKRTAMAISYMYETARQKDGDLIQRLMAHVYAMVLCESGWKEAEQTLSEAEEMGFKILGKP